jgi:hypothetical protein
MMTNGGGILTCLSSANLPSKSTQWASRDVIPLIGKGKERGWDLLVLEVDLFYKGIGGY